MSTEKQRGFLHNLTHRRVPQIIGVYIGAIWLIAEISGWFEERFNWPEIIGSSLFISLLVLIPSVFAIAYYHGAPGKDRWTRVEVSIVTLNLVALAIILNFVVIGKSLNSVDHNAIETKYLLDENGSPTEISVANQKFKKKVAFFFWQKDKSSDSESFDWLETGIPYILSLDIEQHPLAKTRHFFSLSRYQLLKRDGPSTNSVVHPPLSLQRSIAEDMNSHFFLTGGYKQKGDNFELEMKLFETANSKLVLEYKVQGVDLLALLDDAGKQILSAMNLPKSETEIVNDSPIRARMSESLEAIELLILGNEAEIFKKDFKQAIELYNKALNVDSTFALAARDLAAAYIALGDSDNAAKAIQQTLNHDYKLLQTEIYALKGQAYGISKQRDKQIKLYEMLSELSPDDEDNWLRLAQAYTYINNDPTNALNAYKQAYLHSPNDANILLQIAQLLFSQAETEESLSYLERYQNLKPDDLTSQMMIAKIYLYQGKHEQALAQIEKAQLLANGSDLVNALTFESEIHLAAGKTDRAKQKILEAISLSTNTQDKLTATGKYTQMLVQIGQIGDAFEKLSEVGELASEVLAPIQVALQIGSQKSLFHALLGDKETALQVLNKTKDQLPPAMTGYLDFAYSSLYLSVKEYAPIADHLIALKELITVQNISSFEPYYIQSKLGYLMGSNCYDAAKATFESARDKLVNTSINVINDEIRMSNLTFVGEYYMFMEDYDEAIKSVEDVKLALPFYPRLNLLLARISIAKNDLEEAKKYIKKLKSQLIHADKQFNYAVDLLSIEKQLEQLNDSSNLGTTRKKCLVPDDLLAKI